MTEDIRTDDAPAPALTALAEACGVATEYWSFFGDRVHVPAATLRAILHAMGVDAQTDAEAEAALVGAEDRPWRRLVPPSVVVREGSGVLQVQVADGHDVSLRVTLEDASLRDIPIPAQEAEARTVDGVTRWRLHVPLPADLPLGWHTIRAAQRAHGASEPDRTAECVLVVTPESPGAAAVAPRSRRPGVGSDGAALLGAVARLLGRRRLRRPRRSGVDRGRARGGLPARQPGARRRGHLADRAVPVPAGDAALPRPPVRAPGGHPRGGVPPGIRPIPARRDFEGRSQRRTPTPNASTAMRRGRRSARRWSSSSPCRGRPARQALLDAYVGARGTAAAGLRAVVRPRGAFRRDARRRARSAPPKPGTSRRRLVARLRDELPTASRSTSGCSGSSTSSWPPRRRPRKARGMRIGIMHDLAVGVHTRGIGRLVAARHVRVGHHGRRAAGHVQPAGAELESAAVAAACARPRAATRRCGT